MREASLSDAEKQQTNQSLVFYTGDLFSEKFSLAIPIGNGSIGNSFQFILFRKNMLDNLKE